MVISATSLSAFETAINSILSSMYDTEIRALRVLSSITNNGFKSGVTYSGYITRLSSGWGSISLVDHTGVDMIIGISGGEYFYNSLASNLANLVKSKTDTGVTTNAYGIGNLTIPYNSVPVVGITSNHLCAFLMQNSAWKVMVYDVDNANNKLMPFIGTVDVTTYYLNT